MGTPRTLVRLTLGAIAGGVLLTNGCALQHGARPAAEFGAVSPRQYCPGDTVTANYDLEMETPCVSRPGLDCAAIGPAVTIASTPASFPAHTSNRLIDRLTFVPTEPRVAVTFGLPASPTTFYYPTVDSVGATLLVGRAIKTTERATQRIDGALTQTLTHTGMCSGAMPVNGYAQIADLPEFSPNLKLRRLCNTNAVPIEATLTGPSGELTRRLDVGQCLALDEPGVPAGLEGARIIGARSLAIDPTTQCDPLQGSTPPPHLQTLVTLSCGQ